MVITLTRISNKIRLKIIFYVIVKAILKKYSMKKSDVENRSQFDLDKI